MPFSVFSLGLPALEEKVSGKERWVGCLKRDQEKCCLCYQKGEKKNQPRSSTQNYPQVATGECYDVGFGGWGHIIIITAANDVFGVLKKCGTHCWNFDSVSLCYTANSRKSHFHTLHWKSEATIKISLLQNTQFMLSVPKMKAKLHPWLHSRLFVQLCSCVCVRARMHMQVLQCLFYNFAGILSVFAVFPSVTKTDIKRYKAGSLL